MAMLDDLVGQAVEAYPSRSQLSNRKLGAFAVGDSSMAPRLMAGGSIRLDKADQLLCDMGQAPIGPGFVSEVEAFQSDTGIGDSKFGSDAAGDPLFPRKLGSGASPLLSTVEQVQAWMRANRSAFEPESCAQAKEDGEQLLPDFSSDGDHREEPAEALTDPPPTDDVRPRGTTVYAKNGPQVILTTRETAALLTLSPSILQRNRVRGGGPRYLRIGGSVRNARVDLLECVLTMRRNGTLEE